MKYTLADKKGKGIYFEKIRFKLMKSGKHRVSLNSHIKICVRNVNETVVLHKV